VAPTTTLLAATTAPLLVAPATAFVPVLLAGAPTLRLALPLELVPFVADLVDAPDADAAKDPDPVPVPEGIVLALPLPLPLPEPLPLPLPVPLPLATTPLRVPLPEPLPLPLATIPLPEPLPLPLPVPLPVTPATPLRLAVGLNALTLFVIVTLDEGDGAHW